MDIRDAAGNKVLEIQEKNLLFNFVNKETNEVYKSFELTREEAFVVLESLSAFFIKELETK